MKISVLFHLTYCMSMCSLVLGDDGDTLARFPVCVTDDDCSDISERGGADYRCFQYRCFPWDDQQLQGEFRSCKKSEDCLKLGEEEAGDGDDWECFRHQDKRKIMMGMCVRKRTAEQCSGPSDCLENEKCVNGFCGEEEYFKALQKLECIRHGYCQDLYLGTHCCYDFSSDILGRKCCDAVGDRDVGVIVPGDELDDYTIAEMSTKVGYIAEDEKKEVCLAFLPEVMNKLSSCSAFITSPPTTETTTTDVFLITTQNSTSISPPKEDIIEAKETSEEMQMQEINDQKETVQNDVKIEEMTALNVAMTAHSNSWYFGISITFALLILTN